MEQLAQLTTLAGKPVEIALTTNGALLAAKARSLKDAGLQRVTVSLDALDDAVFRRMSDTDLPVARILDGIEAARAAGLAPLKVNTVVQRGVNDDQILPLVRHFKGSGVGVRFIEYMDVGGADRWSDGDVLTAAQARGLVAAAFRWSRSTRPAAPTPRSATATPTAAAKWVSSPASRSRSAAPARAHASPPTARSTPACSPPGA